VSRGEEESGDYTQGKLIEMFEKMVRIRFFEEKIIELVTAGRRILCHLYIGEEAVAVGACTNLRNDDYITSTHRGHGHSIAKGTDVKSMMAELLQKKTEQTRVRVDQCISLSSL